MTRDIINPELRFIRRKWTGDNWLFTGITQVYSFAGRPQAMVCVTGPDDFAVGNLIGLGELAVVDHPGLELRELTKDEHAALLAAAERDEYDFDPWFVNQQDIRILRAYNAGFEARIAHIRDRAPFPKNPFSLDGTATENIIAYAWERGWARHAKISERRSTPMREGNSDDFFPYW